MAVSTKNKIKTLLELVRKPSQLSALLSLKSSGYLTDIGWFEAFESKSPLDKNRKPIPWFTYACNEFISSRLSKEFIVAEFGSGNSTFYFSDRVKEVNSIEHNKEWFDEISSKEINNIKLFLTPSDSEADYLDEFKKIEKNLNIVVVDGIHRNKCTEVAITKLSANGVIILDDSERKEYLSGIQFLLENNFKRIDFFGIAPGLLYSKCTTIFYKSNNCLNI